MQSRIFQNWQNFRHSSQVTGCPKNIGLPILRVPFGHCRQNPAVNDCWPDISSPSTQVCSRQQEGSGICPRNVSHQAWTDCHAEESASICGQICAGQSFGSIFGSKFKLETFLNEPYFFGST